MRTEATKTKKEAEESPEVREQRIKENTEEVLGILAGIPEAERILTDYERAECKWNDQEFTESPRILEDWARKFAQDLENEPPNMGYETLKEAVEQTIEADREAVLVYSQYEGYISQFQKYLVEPYKVLVDGWLKANPYLGVRLPGALLIFYGYKGHLIKHYPAIFDYIEEKKLKPEDLPASPDDYTEEDLQGFRDYYKSFLDKEIEKTREKHRNRKPKSELDVFREDVSSHSISFNDLTPEQKKPTVSGDLFPITSSPLSMDLTKRGKFQATFDTNEGIFIGKETISIGNDLTIKCTQKGFPDRPFHYTPQHKAILESYTSIILESRGKKDPADLMISGKQILRKIGGGFKEEAPTKADEDLVFRVMSEMKFTPYKVSWIVKGNFDKYANLGKEGALYSQYVNVSITKVDGTYYYTPMWEKKIGYIPGPFYFDMIQGLIYTHPVKMLDTRDLSHLNIRDRRGKKINKLENRKYVKFLKEQILGKLHTMETTQKPERPGSYIHELNYKTLSDELFLDDNPQEEKADKGKKGKKDRPSGLTREKWYTFRNNAWIIFQFIHQDLNGCDNVEEINGTKVKITNIHLPKREEIPLDFPEPKKKGKKSDI